MAVLVTEPLKIVGSAATMKFTVLVGGKVSVAVMAVAELTNPVTVAPPAAVRVTAPEMLKPVSASVNGTKVAVLGPALKTETVKMTVPVGLVLAMLGVLVTRKSTGVAMVSVALTADELAPKLVLNEPAGMLLTNTPLAVPVTLTVNWHWPSAGMMVPADIVTEFAPSVAAATPVAQVSATAEGVALTMPAGYTSVNSALRLAATGKGLINTMRNCEMPLLCMVAGVKLFSTRGPSTSNVSLEPEKLKPTVVLKPPAAMVLV